MKILVESGATKSDWRVISGDGSVSESLRLPGINVSTMDSETIGGIISDAMNALGVKSAEGLYFYTAGVVTEEVEKALVSRLNAAASLGEIEICDDLTAAARALFGRGSGIVAILGTGSNSCFYDGRDIFRKVRSGGFILGDEGGGAVLGKLFLADYLKGLVPGKVAEAFEASFDSSYSGIVQNVYRSQAPSAYLGSFAPFILSFYSSEPYIQSLVDSNFKSFINRALRAYDTARYPLGITGGFAFACKDILERLCSEAGIRIGKIVAEPAQGLAEYHSSL